MDIRLYNTLSHGVETFAPADPPHVYMYTCGPTVYDYAHIGNFRSFIVADVLRRFLELSGHQVHQVMNLTDVGHMTDDQLADGGGEDKMAAAARRLKEAKKTGQAPVDNPDDPYQVAQFFIDAFLADAKLLGLKVAGEYPAHMPRATQHVPRMQAMIARLIETGHAYVAPDGAVYYSVQTFPDYGRLSGNTLDRLRTGKGGRVLDEHQSLKRHPADFLLWKPDPAHIMKWDSPWGVGYPGWHIECSTMSLEVLSELAGRPLETIDLHTGGEDNIFPHHECEIAQSRGATGQPFFARFWLHARFLLVDGQKMSKSKGNFYTVRDVLDGRVTGNPVDPAVLRYELLKAHYRSNLNFTGKGLEDSARAVQKLRGAAADLTQRAGQDVVGGEVAHPVLARFSEALADDLNVSGAMGEVFTWLGAGQDEPAVALAVLHKIDEVLAVLPPAATAVNPGVNPGAGANPGADAGQLAKALDAARAAKDFAAADRIRKELQGAGYEVMTTKAGTTVRKKLA